MKASEIMTRDVVTVRLETPVQNVAKLMINHRISGIPVIEDSGLVGIISENDLLRRVELGTEKARPRWLQLLTTDATLLAEYVHTRGQQARDVMTTNVITVSPDAPLADIAEIMESHHIKRVPVVGHGKVMGIVSRANLIQALATFTPARTDANQVDDPTIRDAVYAEIEKIPGVPSAIMNPVTVSDGVVHLWGYVSSGKERRAVCIAAEQVAGVKEVKDHRSGHLLPPW
jgi:CBS domain-containing protein